MKVLKWLAIIILGLLILVAGFLAYLGVFTPLQVSQKVMGPYTIAFERYVGPFQNTGKVFDRVHQTLVSLSIESTNGLGIYIEQ